MVAANNNESFMSKKFNQKPNTENNVLRDGQYTIRILTVTKEMAEEFIRNHGRNRLIDKREIDKYSNLMSKEKWFPYLSTLDFDEYDNLVNGQHRLNAIISSGKAQKFVVISGHSDDAIFSTDNGKRRNFADRMNIKHDVGINGSHTGVINNIFLPKSQPNTFSDDEKEKVLLRYYDYIIDVVNYKPNTETFKTTVSNLAVVRTALTKAYINNVKISIIQEFLDIFYGGIITEINHTKSVILLREDLATHMKNTKSSKSAMYRKVCHVLNCFVKREIINEINVKDIGLADRYPIDLHLINR